MLLALLAPLALAGCSDPQDEYCSALEEEQQTLAELGGSGFGEAGAVARTSAVFERLRDAAPDDLRDEWDTFHGAWQGLEQALDAADADETMFERGERPEGMSQEDYERISQAAVQLRSTQVVEAVSGIEQHALDVCKVDLGATGPTG